MTPPSDPTGLGLRVRSLTARGRGRGRRVPGVPLEEAELLHQRLRVLGGLGHGATLGLGHCQRVE